MQMRLIGRRAPVLQSLHMGFSTYVCYTWHLPSPVQECGSSSKSAPTSGWSVHFEIRRLDTCSGVTLAPSF